MIRSKRKILRQVISLLTAFWLLPVVAATEPLAALRPGKASADDQLAPIRIAPETGFVLIDQRTNAEAFDSLLKDTLILDRPPADSAGASIFSPTESSRRAAQCAGQTTIAIRAPPCAPS